MANSIVFEKLKERLAKAKESLANATTIKGIENAKKRIADIEKEIDKARKLLKPKKGKK